MNGVLLGSYPTEQTVTILWGIDLFDGLQALCASCSGCWASGFHSFQAFKAASFQDYLRAWEWETGTGQVKTTESHCSY